MYPKIDQNPECIPVFSPPLHLSPEGNIENKEDTCESRSSSLGLGQSYSGEQNENEVSPCSTYRISLKFSDADQVRQLIDDKVVDDLFTTDLVLTRMRPWCTSGWACVR